MKSNEVKELINLDDKYLIIVFCTQYAHSTHWTIDNYRDYFMNKGKKVFFRRFPENEKHPIKQLEFAEQAVRLASNKKRRVVFNTVSETILKKINNLILDKKIDYKLILPILDREKIMDIDETGIKDESFAYVNEILEKERQNILSQGVKELNEIKQNIQ